MRPVPSWFGWFALAVSAGLVAAASGCGAVVPTGVVKMEINHRGKPVCAYYLPSDQSSDDNVDLRIHPGKCPDKITDEPVAPSP